MKRILEKKKPKETDKERIFRKAQKNDKYVKKYFNEYIIKGKNNNDTGMLNSEEFEIYKRYRKIVNPKSYNTTKVPTYGAVKKFYEETHKRKLKQTYHKLFFLCILWILIINCYVNRFFFFTFF